MRKPAKPPRYQPPIADHPPWAIVYGPNGIVLGYAESKADADRQATALNVQAPQYNHRTKELSP